MLKKLILLPMLLVLSGCVCSDFSNAKSMIHSGEAECVIVRNGKIAAFEKGRGISPLLKLYDEKSELMQGSIVVDKVIGRAAAFIVIKGGASEVYGKIMSEDAKILLEKHNIVVSYNLLVPYILNNQRNGLCPLEDSVKNITAVDEAIAAMRQRISDLRKGIVFNTTLP